MFSESTDSERPNEESASPRGHREDRGHHGPRRGHGGHGGRGPGHGEGHGPGPEGGEGFGRGFGPRGRGGRGGGRGFGRPGGWQQADLPAADDAGAWFSGRLPGSWFTGAPQVSVDREEIIVIGTLAAPEVPEGTDAAGIDAAATGRISRFREESRDERIAVALEAEARYGRKVAWGATIGDTQVLFSHLAVPVMTRLRQPERQVLDTLVDAGVARSRSEALAWSVRLVGEHTDTWLSGLREAMTEVEKLRTQGPDL